jgi:simple sugar transport system substrate-binding protein
MLDRGELLRRVSAGAGAAVLAGAGPPRTLAANSGTGQGSFPAHPRWKFAFVSHLTTSPLFVPLQYGIQDGCALVGCAYGWTGSPAADTAEVVKAVNSAVDSKADGIALPIVDAVQLDRPVARAIAAGIPVVAYHADADRSASRRIAFVGPDPYATGLHVGDRIARLVRRGDVALFVGKLGAPPVARRVKGVLAGIRRSGAPITSTVVITTRDPYEAAARVESYVLDHPGLRGLFSLELESTEAVGAAVVKHHLSEKDVHAGGYGTVPATLDLIKQGKLDFTLDEQPYSQGFVPVIQLFLAKLSGGLLAPSDTDVPLILVTKKNVGIYSHKTRYEGSSSRQRYPIS